MPFSTKPPVTAQPLIERRRGYRQHVRSTAVLRCANPEAAPESIPVHVFELSISGVGFSANRPLEIGTTWEIDVCDQRHRVRKAEIRSCRTRPDGMFDIGAQFC